MHLINLLCYVTPPALYCQQHWPFSSSSAAGRLGGSFGYWGRDLSILRWTEAFFNGHGQGPRSRRDRFLDHHDIILTLLAKVQLGKVEAFHTRSLQLRRRAEEKKRGESFRRGKWKERWKDIQLKLKRSKKKSERIKMNQTVNIYLTTGGKFSVTAFITLKLNHISIWHGDGYIKLLKINLTFWPKVVSG